MSFRKIDGSLLNIDNIIKYAKLKKYNIFEDNGNYNLNIWFIRNLYSEVGKFDDIQLVFWKHKGIWNKQIYTCTTDPGKHYLLNPLTKYGTAIVRPGQYNGVFELGYHKGRKDHPALVQRSPITVIRDFNKDINLDFSYDNYENLKVKSRPHSYNKVIDYQINNKTVFRTETGMMGINNHRAHKNIVSKIVGKYSAGCLVQNYFHKYYDEFIPTIEKAKSIWGNSFTATIVTEEDMLKQLYAIK